MSVPVSGPLPSADAAWPAGRPVGLRPLSSLSRSVPVSAGAATEGWSPFLASSEYNVRGGIYVTVFMA